MLSKSVLCSTLERTGSLALDVLFLSACFRPMSPAVGVQLGPGLYTFVENFDSTLTWVESGTGLFLHDYENPEKQKNCFQNYYYYLGLF